MSLTIADRMRESRRFKRTISGFHFILRRPTDVEALRLHRTSTDFSDIAREFVCGWEGVTENDVIGGGGSDPIPYDAATWAEWCADRPDMWTDIATAVLDAYKAHSDILERSSKNSPPG